MLAAETEVLTRYDQVGEVLRHFQAAIPRWMDKHTLETAASRLGLLHRGVFVFAAESEMAVLMDYCLYNMPKDGLNLAAQYMRSHPPLAGSDEEQVLNAMSHARHALLSVTKLVPGVGVECYDLLRRESLFMVNRGFSRTGQQGAVLASRLVSLPDFEMSTGADLPVFRGTVAAIEKVLNDLQRQLGAGFDNADDPRIAPQLSTGIIRACLRNHAAEWIRHGDSIEDAETQEVPSFFDDLDRGGPSSRNRPCPCGSGLKYKRCCGQLKRW